jgi:phosphonopyruvate decarboxylase
VLRSADVVEAFRAHGAEFWTGVPDSLLAPLGSHLHTTLNSSEHVIASSEGAAIALATGHYLASGYPAVVYLQNSGLGNTVNPLLSLVDPAVLGIPMVLVIGVARRT